ncbi:hypothetical protein HJC23_006224 [Cyclotella cryptica]|uniref:Amino acid transporter transmembrane domain-containing protein n=1 Tax=Cyclotella cryptica TaxID=29204 RepID=A0ABD3PWC5_9STRA|eukprot:CCRYP_010868-RC/>CCRYP_010868-RC protein AED:0.08 eAED:0.08 QI:1987/1/1/1/0.71/0.5/8/627/523
MMRCFRIEIWAKSAAFLCLMLAPHALCFTPPTTGWKSTARIRTGPRDLQVTPLPEKIRMVELDDEPCIPGENVVSGCNLSPDDHSQGKTPYLQSDSTTSTVGTQTKLSAAINLGKCICGAGSFALPHVFLKEGVLGGTIAMTVCAFLAICTMQSINRSRSYLESEDGEAAAPRSYVQLTEIALGKSTANVVFALTLAASLGVCSTYIAFIGQTLYSLSIDSESNNIVHTLFPNVDVKTLEVATAGAVLPLSLIRNYGIFAFTSALGVTAVLGGICVTLAYGIVVDPGGGIMNALSAVSTLRMWPESVADAFGGSFGTIAYLFCVNFLTFPIMNSMKNPSKDYNDSVAYAVSAVWFVNVIFAIICLGFYGDQTEDLVLQNLNNGPYLSALKILLCVDLLFTFPVVFSSGRQILENALLNGGDQNVRNVDDSTSLMLSRATLTIGAVSTCFGLSQVGGFGVVANLVGGVAQGTLAFIIPAAIDIALSRRQRGKFDESEIAQWLIGGFGVAVVASVTYFTLNESIS